jgi:hypothetical protein
MGEPVELLAEAVPLDRLDRLDDACVQHALMLLQHATVRDFVGQRVCGRVFEIGKERGLVAELCSLQVPEPRA